MRPLTWTPSHAVFVTEIDDEHIEIFEALTSLQATLSGAHSRAEVNDLTRRLIDRIGEHFAHEERLMRAARYASYGWHKEKHDNALARIKQFATQLTAGDNDAGPSMVEYLTAWLNQHTRLPDAMLGAFLRNRRAFSKVTLRAGTKPMDSCEWFDSNGNRFDPRGRQRPY